MTALIPLHYRKAVVAHALVDEADLGWLSEWKWLTHYIHLMTDDWGYVTRSARGGPISLHRTIVGLERGDPRVVHHANENTHDNRRSNLVVCRDRVEHLRLPHSRRLHHRRQQRRSFSHTVPWSRELFEETA